MEQIKKKKSKAVTFTLNEETLSMLAELAEKNSNSQSYEVRRLIKDEYTRKFKQRETIK
jgi:predicted transcriptional regulator